MKMYGMHVFEVEESQKLHVF